MSIRTKLHLVLVVNFLLFIIFHLISMNYLNEYNNLSDQLRYRSVEIAFLVLLYFGLFYLLDKYFISRICQLLDKFMAITITDDASQYNKLSEKQDEINLLEQQFVNIQGKLTENQHLILIMENLMDLVSELDATGKLIYASPSHKTLLGHDPEKLLQVAASTEFFHPDDIEKTFASFEKVVRLQQPDRVELRCKHANGDYLWFESLHYPLYNKQGEFSGMLVSSREITDRKRMEEKLTYLSHNDALTGLYNRTYFEQEMRRMKKTRNVPIGIIICDINGLKLINDGVGHNAGDKLLKSASFLLKSCFRDEDVVARIGGDEFAVLLPNSDKNIVENAAIRIKKALITYNEGNPKLPLSISVGYAAGQDGAELPNLYKEADDQMYQEKNLRNKSSLYSSAHILIKALVARHAVEGNEERLQTLTALFGQALNLPEQQIADLSLLGRFHDVGKVGIPDQIIFKGTVFSDEERRTMQRHSEIGSRLALAIPEINHIAGWILKHHEWYNGQGYPLGLQGEAIPLECRIFALVDAYEAMTSPRPFCKTKSHEQAVEELKLAAGTQFDPQLLQYFLRLLADPLVIQKIEHMKKGRAS